MTGTYEDIIRLPHPVSARHAPMPPADRAAQFSPFAALTGYEESIAETARLTDPEQELDEQDLLQIGQQLQLLADHTSEQPEVELLLFRPDARKAGGRLERCRGLVRRVDGCNRLLELTDRTRIPFSALREIDSPLFRRLEDEEGGSIYENQIL